MGDAPRRAGGYSVSGHVVKEGGEAPPVDEGPMLRHVAEQEYQTIFSSVLVEHDPQEVAEPEPASIAREPEVGSEEWHARNKQRSHDEQLWRAAASGLVKDLEEALSLDNPSVQVNSQGHYARTALHVAADVGNPGCVKLLLEARASVGARTRSGRTSLHMASERGHLEVSRLLLDSRASVMDEADEGNIPLHLAAARGKRDVVALLLERGGTKQLNVWNRSRQRPPEVASDFAVSLLFHEYFRTAQAKGAETQEDRYAGRTPVQDSSVVLRNSRADTVMRLLHRTSQQVSADQDEDEAEADQVPVLRTRRSEHFAQVHAENNSLEVKQVGPDDFDIVKQLGRGSFGEVYLVKCKHTQQEYAMKILLLQKVRRNNTMRYAYTERNVMTYIKHPYIVSLYYAFQTFNHLVMVVQYGHGGNLQSLISSEKKLQEDRARIYEAELLLAIVHLHLRNIVFRDMKPENVVLDREAHCMLIDFGLSKEGVEDVRGGKSFCGSPAFIAPEIIQNAEHGKAVDIYGLGVMLYAMLSGMPPYYHRDKATLLKNITNATLTFPDIMRPKAVSLVEALMQRDPSKRLGAGNTEEVQSHPFFEEIDFDALLRREVPVPCETPEPRTVAQDTSIRNPFVADTAPRKHGARGKIENWDFFKVPEEEHA
eukprot:TRINITY_DN27590_c0_g1_i1.p1 TRINITY_DN27590_c0_g1~~TRINITY_DN27590_c0_g1_i1.p1  ORF type:complete len:681 (-),score=122.46 TRINITY_DN27590_c0_g1_i1:220-2181(-)